MPNTTPTTRATRSNSATGISLQDIKDLIESSENRVIAALKGEIDDLKTAVTSLRQQISSLESQQQKLESNYDEVNGELMTLKGEMLLTQVELSNELDERVRRCQNFIISGLPEPKSSDTSEDDDKEKCYEVLREIGCDVDSVIETRRIGRPNQERPCLLRVTCDSVAAKESALRNAKKLRNASQFRGVYINPDRTPMQQRLWKDLLLELKCRREQGENAIIFRNRVIRRSEAKNL